MDETRHGVWHFTFPYPSQCEIPYPCLDVYTPIRTRLGLLRSAVGMTHSLRSDLWWTIPFRILLGHFGIPIGSLAIRSALARHTGVRRVSGSRQSDHVITFDQSQSLLSWFSLSLNLCQSILAPIISSPQVYMGCALAIMFQVHFLNVPWYLVHFQGSISGSP